jgi:hypothetical protein
MQISAWNARGAEDGPPRPALFIHRQLLYVGSSYSVTAVVLMRRKSSVPRAR